MTFLRFSTQLQIICILILKDFWTTFLELHHSRGSENGENSRKFVTNSTVFWSFRAVLQPLLQCERQKIVQKIIKNSRNTFTYVSFLAENQAKFFETLGSVFNKIGPKRRKGHHVYADCENFFFQININGSVEKLSYELHITV